MVPEAAAAGALYVSAENAMFANTFGGAQIVEVVVIDPNRASTSEAQGEPVVKVDEHQLRMAQGVDGNWYGYFGDTNDKSNASAALIKGDFNEANDVISAIGGISRDYNPNSSPGTITNAPVLSAWNGTGAGSASLAGSGAAVNGTKGQIGIPSDNDWPIIQLYTLKSTTGTYSFDDVN
jgi:hypothetical protein